MGFDWAPAFVLGAIVSPTDPVAATAIGRQLGVPHRIISIVEGESLINDGTALVAYKFAVAAVVTGSFSLLEASGEFVVSAIGGVAVGIGVGAIVAAVRRRLDNPPVEITIALATAYFAYLPAEAIGVSGVLAAVTVGIYMGRLTSQLTTPTTRIQGIAVWEILVFLLNSALFVLIGLQLPLIVDGLDDGALGELIAQGALIAGAVMLIRLLWVFPITYGSRFLFRPSRGDDPYPPWEETLLIAWTGMRGAVTLAAALAVPLTIDGGGAFPERDEIIFLAFSVIMGTLVHSGPHPAAPDPLPRRRRRQPPARARGEQGAHQGRERRDRARRRARRRGMGARRNGRTRSAAVRLPAQALHGAVRRGRNGIRRHRGALGELPAPGARAPRRRNARR